MDTTRTPLMRFVTLGGAHVAVTANGTNRHDWNCLGCGKGEDGQPQSTARLDANRHASTCRSVPKDTPSQSK